MRFKKIIFIVFLCFILLSTIYAEVPSFEGGLVGDPTMNAGDYNYTEVLFISGEPIVLTGTVSLPNIPTDKDIYSISYDYALINIEKEVIVNRTVAYDVTKDVKDEYSQTIYKYDINKLEESITIGEDNYILSSYLYNKSMIYDNTPAIDYFSGNLNLKRTYYKNGDRDVNEGKYIIEISSDHNEGAMIGYHHLWGDAETYISKMTINATEPNPEYNEADEDSNENLEWWGSVDIRSSEQTFSNFKYQSTAPQSISFFGSYVRVDEIENVFQYSYDLPLIVDGIKDPLKRNIDEDSLKNDKIVDGSSMIIPKIKDIGDHWAEDDIFLLSSLEIINNNSDFFSPDQPLSRIEFAEMVSNAIATIDERTKTDIIRSLRPGATTLFIDIPNDYEFYNYVLFVYNKGIMIGHSNYFFPNDNITRSEVITVMINALGLENRAPALPFETRYSDDEDIADWAKRFIYMADEINLVTGFPDNTIKPNSYVTRAEGSTMIMNMINHMKDNIRIDYREKIINRY